MVVWRSWWMWWDVDGGLMMNNLSSQLPQASHQVPPPPPAAPAPALPRLPPGCRTTTYTSKEGDCDWLGPSSSPTLELVLMCHVRSACTRESRAVVDPHRLRYRLQDGLRGLRGLRRQDIELLGAIPKISEPSSQSSLICTRHSPASASYSLCNSSPPLPQDTSPPRPCHNVPKRHLYLFPRSALCRAQDLGQPASAAAPIPDSSSRLHIKSCPACRRAMVQRRQGGGQGGGQGGVQGGQRRG